MLCEMEKRSHKVKDFSLLFLSQWTYSETIFLLELLLGRAWKENRCALFLAVEKYTEEQIEDPMTNHGTDPV